MSKRATYLIDLNVLKFDDSTNTTWVHALPLGSYNHPVYGKIEIDSTRANKFAKSVKEKTRGIECSINYDHNNEAEASGWVKDAEARGDGLWLQVDFVKDAADKIKDKKYRYFSVEFDDQWEDSQGNKHEDVIFGGALTNRPFMKNLTPINLSDAYVSNAFDLVATVTGQDVDSLKGGEKGMNEDDLKKIIEGVAAKLAEGNDKNKDEPKPTLGLEEIEDLKKLAEENHLVKGLIQHFEAQGLSLAETSKKLRETTVKARMSEFDKGSKLVLTPTARKLTEEILLSVDVELADKIWTLLNEFRRSQTFMVELGERSGASVRYGTDKSAGSKFNDLTNELVGKGVSYADAVSQVSRDNPELYNEYRIEMMNS